MKFFTKFQKPSKRTIALLIAAILMISVSAFGYFSDKETSNGNTFTAGSINLRIDGGDTNVVKFTASNMKADWQSCGRWELKNDGTLPGYVNIKKITVSDSENGLLEPEIEFGDDTADEGELSSLVSVKLFSSTNDSVWWEADDHQIYSGFCEGLGSSYNNLNILLQPGEKIYIVAQFNWWSNGDADSTGMSDGMEIDLEFKITQKSQ
ncbi:MAG: TasA family protein [Candidatus Colwellbacteria bacterium]|nr:TasA family protein [Candidatus Colwellbacteria bacterium]